MWKKYLALYAITIVVAILAAACRTIQNGTLSLLCSFTVIAVYTYIALKKTKDVKPFYSFLIILVGISTIEFIPRLFDNINSMYSLISSFSIVIGVLCGYVLFSISSRTKQWVFTVVAITFIVLYATIGLDCWKNKLHSETHPAANE